MLLEDIIDVTFVAVLHKHTCDGFVMSGLIDETTKVFDDVVVAIFPHYPHLELSGTVSDVFRFVSFLDRIFASGDAFNDEYTSIEAPMATKIMGIGELELRRSDPINPHYSCQTTL